MEHLLSSIELSKASMQEILRIADAAQKGKSVLKGHQVLVLLFDEPSTRTRVSFEVAMARLGGSSIYIDSHTSQISRGETLEDTARVISSYADFIAVRTNNQADLVRIAKASSVPVINALTHLEHPTQALADVYTIIKKKGGIKGLKIAFIGDIAQNTCNSLMLTSVKMGASFSLVGPKGCSPDPRYLKEARKFGKVDVSSSLKEGLSGADVVYTDTFVSMGDELVARKKEKMFATYQLNSLALSYAKKDAIVMHPLPAHRGKEITSDVIDGKRSLVWEQARSKLVVEKAVLLWLSRRRGGSVKR
ncbi:MAG: ornithine carbamoyltransferase [Candidatus Micrarchaeota archaeon]|nr:ornithine carbamoyltransferase [Candidatus Micrarchaeota archaeon]